MKTTAQYATLDWYWEGNVVEALARHLVREGWTIESKADTYSKQQGVDIRASKDGALLLVEAKGYPSTGYRDPNRAGEKKPTNPTLQAQHWYSHALLKALRLQTKHPEATVALGFPDFPRYRTLIEETHTGLRRLGIALLTVKENGDVLKWGLDRSNWLFVRRAFHQYLGALPPHNRGRHFQISAKCIGELHLAGCAAFGFEDQWRPDKDANALCPRGRHVQTVRAI